MRVSLDSGVRRFDGGRTVLGGSPARLLRLGERGARLLDAWHTGEPVAADSPDRVLARRLLDAGIIHPDPESSTATRDAVTLVVPVKDNAQGLARLLAATNDIPARIVVDDGSAPPLGNATLRHERAHGPAAARNSGWRSAATPLVAFLDSDTDPAPGWLDTILPLFDDPAVAAVAPRVTASTASGLVGHYESHRSALDMGAAPALVHPYGRVRYLPSAALVVRAEALRAIGGFDESLRFGEDVDLVWRLLAAGYSIRYQPLSAVRHDPRRTVHAFLRQRFGYGTSAAPLALRHRDLMYAAYLPRVLIAQYALAGTGHRSIAVTPSVIATARTARRLYRRGVPLPTATTLAARGQLSLIAQLIHALLRVWWPLALCHQRGRKLLAAAYAADAARSFVGLRVLLMSMVDNAAYGLGVWTGCVRHRTAVPLLPRWQRTGGTP